VTVNQGGRFQQLSGVFEGGIVRLRGCGCGVGHEKKREREKRKRKR
jgi:hypothetical protein